jgi:hypothetical protein
MTRLKKSLGLVTAAGGAALAGCWLLPEWSLGDFARRFCALCQEYPGLYWGPAYAALAALIVQVGLPYLLPGAVNRATCWTSRTLFVLLTIATVVLFRWPGLAPLELNPDESNVIAVALTLRDDPRYFVSAEYGTHGPVVSFALLPVQLAGMQLEYGAARLVGLGLLLGSLFFMFGTLRAFFAEFASRAVVTPLTVCISFLTNGRDCVAFNAEHPAVFMLCAAAYGCARLAIGPARGTCGRALATGLVLGLVPFTKLQAAPMGLVLVAVAVMCLVARFRGQGRMQLAAGLALCAGGLVPASLAALYLWHQGLFAHFWTSYIGVNFALANESEVATRLGHVTGMEAKFTSFLAWAPKPPFHELMLPYFLVAGVAGVLLMALVRRGGSHWRLFLAGGAVVLASLWSIITPGYPFGHYLLFLLFPLSFLAAAVLATLHQTLPRRAGQLGLVVICLAVPVATASTRAFDLGNPWLATKRDEGDAVVATIRDYAEPGEKLVVWGWMDRYYVLTGMRQGTLHPNTYWEIASNEGSPLGGYFYRLFLQRLKQAKAPVFVDAVGPNAFAFRDPDRYGVKRFRELRDQIAARYVLVWELILEKEVEGMRVYVSKERLAERPATREVDIPVVPVAWPQMEWQHRYQTGRGKGSDSYLVFALPKVTDRPKPLWVKDIAITCAYEPAGEPATLRVVWQRRDQTRFVDGPDIQQIVETGSGEKTLMIPVNETIDHIRIYPDNKPSVCTISRIVLHTSELPLTKAEEGERLAYQVREVVNRSVPPDATVLVISYGDDDLLKLEGRKAWHFPQNEDGTFQPALPASGAEAVAWLEAVRAKRGQFLVIPETASWWLDENEGYKQFKRHLDKNYRLVVHEENVCSIFDLR